jgi:hypothetical protein
MEDTLEFSAPKPNISTGLSYKFQRLREKLRQAITSGELNGKLPGERSLAKRFHVNAKTLSKALTDLAAEGLLDRSIGRGTYVKGYAPISANLKRWLVVCDPNQTESDLVQLLRAAHPSLDVVSDVSSIRPSFLNQFSAVIDLAKSTPDAFLRDLVVRNIPVVVVGREPKTYSTHAVVFDVPFAAARLGRDLLLAGHRRLAAVEAVGHAVLAPALRTVAARYDADATVDPSSPSEIGTMIESGITAFICPDLESAYEVKAQLDKLGIPIPGPVAIAAIGTTSAEHPFSGHFATRSEEVDAINQLLNESPSSRPTTLWLTGRSIDRGTISPIAADSNSSTARYNSVIA